LSLGWIPPFFLHISAKEKELKQVLCGVQNDKGGRWERIGIGVGLEKRGLC
jgi:hypothetical protein